MKTPQRFIVVDDDPLNNLLCNSLIKKVFGNTDIKLFEEPEASLKYIQRAYDPGSPIPTVLFLDINMPTMTGWNFLEVFKSFNEQIRQQFTIYILSSSIDHNDKDKAESNPSVSGFI